MTDFYKALLEEISALPASKMAGIKWEDSSYCNDACGSIMYNHDNDQETYVQLFAFETKADAIQELGEQYGTQYSIKVSINGETDWEDAWDGDDREEAMVQAIIAAEELIIKVEDPIRLAAYELTKMPITSEDEGRAFIFAMAKAGLMFHFDDDAEDCLREHNLPTSYVDGIQSQVNKLFEVCKDPFDHAIDAFHAADPDGEKDISEMNNNGGFEHEGQWITDRTKSPCGRFDLTEEESLKTYGHPKTQPAQEPATVPNFYDALADELNARTNQIDAEWYALPTHYGATDVSYDFSVPENDDGFPTRVLLKTWLFDDEPEFEVRVVVNGEHDTAYKGKDRNTAIAFSIAKAVQINAEWVPVNA